MWEETHRVTGRPCKLQTDSPRGQDQTWGLWCSHQLSDSGPSVEFISSTWAMWLYLCRSQPEVREQHCYHMKQDWHLKVFHMQTICHGILHGDSLPTTRVDRFSVGLCLCCLPLGLSIGFEHFYSICFKGHTVTITHFYMALPNKVKHLIAEAWSNKI